MYEFCTYFDHRYLPQMLALVGSLRRSCPTFRLFALCLDEEARLALASLGLPEVVPVPLAELERAYPALPAVRSGRSRLEYYFTCSPFLPAFVLDRFADVQTITYLDADLFFFADPRPLFEEIGPAPVAIIGHRYPARLRDLEIYGVYNVGWLTFRRGAVAASCLGWWQERCVEWCFDRPEAGRFADQKYLDEWPARFPGTVVLQHRGAGIAPWNLEDHPIAFAGGRGVVDGHPLIFVHFHGVKRVGACVWDLGFAPYGSRATGVVVRRVFGPYLDAVRRGERRVRRLGVRPSPAPTRGTAASADPTHGRSGLLARAYRASKAVFRRRYAVRCFGLTP
jgi:hypothetical protein